MKMEFTKEWCLRMAELEAESTSNFDVGPGTPQREVELVSSEDIGSAAPDLNIAFGRFVRLMRRHRQLSLEKLAEDARVEITELVEIEEDARHRPDPRTVYQLAQHFQVPTPRLMQLAGLSERKDSQLVEQAIRFAARSEPVEKLNDVELAALEAFVVTLSERS